MFSASVSSFHSLSFSDEVMSCAEFELEVDAVLKRFLTFKNWPLHDVDPLELARAGFAFIGEKDIVQCSYCEGRIGSWTRSDVPLRVHDRFYHYCPLVRALLEKNISEGAFLFDLQYGIDELDDASPSRA